MIAAPNWLGAAPSLTDAMRCSNELIVQASSSTKILTSSPVRVQTRSKVSLGWAPSWFMRSHSFTHIHNKAWTLSIIRDSSCFDSDSAVSTRTASCAQNKVQHEEPRSAWRSEQMSC